MVDFAIEPEFQAKLDWMDTFVRDKVQPLEYLYDYDKDAPYDTGNVPLRKIIRHLQGFEPKVAAQLERETGLKAGQPSH